MTLIFIITVVYSLVIIFDLIPKFKAAQYKEFWISVSLLSVSLLMQYKSIFNIEVDSITVMISNLIKSFIS